MKENSLVFGLLIAIVVLSTALVLQKDADTQNTRTIDVTGISKYYAEPNIAYLQFSLETMADTAKEAGELNAAGMDEIRFALYRLGVPKEDIETSGYHVYPRTRWINNEYEVIGYTATQSLKVKYTDVNEVGEVIDSVLDAGANRVESIYFDLDDDTKEQLKKDALEEASKDAKAKAEAIAKGLGVQIIGIENVSVPETYYSPYYRAYSDSAESNTGTKTEIDPTELSYSVSVFVSFRTK